jgi:thioesterase domain-containing protein
MPNIMVVADTANGSDAVFLAERLMTVQLDDAHFAAQLVERLKWAGEDAEHAERGTAIRQPRMAPSRPNP